MVGGEKGEVALQNPKMRNQSLRGDPPQASRQPRQPAASSFLLLFPVSPLLSFRSGRLARLQTETETAPSRPPQLLVSSLGLHPGSSGDRLLGPQPVFHSLSYNHLGSAPAPQGLWFLSVDCLVILLAGMEVRCGQVTSPPGDAGDSCAGCPLGRGTRPCSHMGFRVTKGTLLCSGGHLSRGACSESLQQNPQPENDGSQGEEQPWLSGRAEEQGPTTQHHGA